MIEAIKQSVSNLFSNPKLLVILILIAIFIGVAVYVYNTYVVPRLYPDYVANKEFVPKNLCEGFNPSAKSEYNRCINIPGIIIAPIISIN